MSPSRILLFRHGVSNSLQPERPGNEAIRMALPRAEELVNRITNIAEIDDPLRGLLGALGHRYRLSLQMLEP